MNPNTLTPELLHKMDAYWRAAKGVYLKQQLEDKLIEHKQCIDKYGEDLQEIRNWKWGP